MNRKLPYIETSLLTWLKDIARFSEFGLKRQNLVIPTYLVIL